jgi:hypothetical protein
MAVGAPREIRQLRRASATAMLSLIASLQGARAEDQNTSTPQLSTSLNIYRYPTSTHTPISRSARTRASDSSPTTPLISALVQTPPKIMSSVETSSTPISA